MSAMSLLGLLVATTFLFSFVQCDGLDKLYTDIYAKISETNAQKIAPGILDPANNEVKVGLTLVRILNVDVHEGSLETIVWLFEDYKDPRLTWNPDEYGNYSKVTLPRTDIWIPDWEVYDGLDQTQYFGEYPAIVTSNGVVTRVPVLKVKVSCDVDDAKQHLRCAFKVGSWVYNGNQLNPVLRSNTGIDRSDYAENKQWHLTNATAVKEVNKYDCCPETYPNIIYTLVLDRKNTCS